MNSAAGFRQGTDRRGRQGASLVELLAAMTAASAVMATSMGLVHRSFSFESRSRGILSDERTALRLARQFRADVHEGATATGGSADAPGGVLLCLESPGRRITYRQESTGLVRLTEMITGEAARENYSFSRSVEWSATQEGRLVSLSGSTPVEAAKQPPLAVEVVAALPPPPVGAAGGEP